MMDALQEGVTVTTAAVIQSETVAQTQQTPLLPKRGGAAQWFGFISDLSPLIQNKRSRYVNCAIKSFLRLMRILPTSFTT